MNSQTGRLIEVDYSHYDPHASEDIVLHNVLGFMYYWSGLLDNDPFLVYHIDQAGDTLVEHGD